MYNLFITDETEKLENKLPSFEKIINSAIKKVIDANVFKFDMENKVFDVSVIIVDDEKIKEINRSYRDKNYITDVISFNYVDFENETFFLNEDYEQEIPLGDIFICMSKIFEQAKEYGHSPIRELSFLTVHGMLHLFGYDHINDVDEKEMFEIQKNILVKLEKENDNFA